MKLSTKGRYGTRVLLDIALQTGKEPVPLKDVASRQEVPLAYLKRVVTPLVNSGILRSMRGTGGGILLAKEPQQINMREVLEQLEGITPPINPETKRETYQRAGISVIQDLWQEIDAAANKILKTTSLQDLVDRYLEKQASQRDMYCI